MIYIEDLVLSIAFYNAIPCDLNRFDKPIMESFADQLVKGIGFTSKQASLAIRLLTKYTPQISSSVPTILSIIQSPSFRIPIRDVTTSYAISIIEDPTLIKSIKLEFPYSKDKIDYIRQNRDNIGNPKWDADRRAWIFPLCEPALVFLTTFLSNELVNYDIDPVIVSLLDQTKEVINTAEDYAPMLVIDNGIPKYVNVSTHLPPLQSTDVLEAMFEARLSGITTWSNEVVEYLNNSTATQATKALLLSDNSGKYNKVDSNRTPIDDLSQIVKYMKTAIFIIPEQNAIDTIISVHKFLKRNGYESKELSVMFRLPKGSGTEFNEYIKNNNLNSPITDSTKFVFVSVKMPKPVLASNFRANCVINFGEVNAHYTMRDFVKNSQNLIHFCPQRMMF